MNKFKRFKFLHFKVIYAPEYVNDSIMKFLSIIELFDSLL